MSTPPIRVRPAAGAEVMPCLAAMTPEVSLTARHAHELVRAEAVLHQVVALAEEARR